MIAEMTDETITTSVSKGVFVFKPPSKKKKAVLNPGNFFQKHPKEHQKCPQLRNETYIDLWEEMEEDIESLKYETNRKLLEDLIKFMKSCHSSRTPDDGPRGTCRRSELPTAALVTGVNVPDHSSIFQSLESMFKVEVSPHVIRLTGKQSSTLKALMSSVVGQFIGQEDAMSSEEEDAGGENVVDVKKIPCTMRVLCSWYQAASKPPPTGSKRKKDEETVHTPSLIIIFEDIEGFVPHVLQDFIQIASQYISVLPFIFVFGIATAVTAIHRILPQSISSLLSIEKFQAPHSSVSLNQLISKVFLTPKYPFKLGAKVFLLLLDLFLYHDFSFTNFVKGIKFSMIDHFFTQPLSFLCCDFEEAVNCVRAMSHDQLELCRQLKSFRRYVENQVPKEQRALLLDDKYTKEVVKDLIEIIHEYHGNFYPVLLCLHRITNGLPQSPLGKKLRELYAMSLEENIVEQDGYKQAMDLVRLVAREELISHLDACIEILDREEGILEEVCSELVEYKQKLISLAESAHLPAGNQSNPKSTSDAEGRSAAAGKVTLQSLQQKLMVEAKRKKELTQYEVVRQDVISYLHKVFKKILVVPHSLTLHEIFYFNNVSEVRQHLHVSPRVTIQTALTNPYVYLQNEACKVEAGSVTGSLPDICIVYKLHLEYGRLINLYDWLQAFVTVVTGELPDEETDVKGKKGKKQKESKAKEKEIDPHLHARFIRAVSELQFLGFIKPTKQKTDHVQRLTWGGC